MTKLLTTFFFTLQLQRLFPTPFNATPDPRREFIMCADCANPCKDRESCRKVLNSGEMDNEPRMMKEEESDFDHRDVGICQKGCGLLLSHTDIVQGDHCCLDALRMLNDGLQERSATLEHEGRMQRLRSGRREQSLLAQVSSIQSEAQLTALKYKRKLHQYMLNINNITEQVIGHYMQVRNVKQLQVLMLMLM